MTEERMREIVKELLHEYVSVFDIDEKVDIFDSNYSIEKNYVADKFMNNPEIKAMFNKEATK